MRLRLSLLFCLAHYLITTTVALLDYDDDLSNCFHDAKNSHFPPPRWLACQELLTHLPNLSKPGTYSTRVWWPIVISNEECSAVLKPNVHPRTRTTTDSVDWAFVHRQASILISKCFRGMRASHSAHSASLFMKGFLTSKEGFADASEGSGLGILIISTPYDAATHRIARSNSEYLRSSFDYSSDGRASLFGTKTGGKDVIVGAGRQPQIVI